MTTFEQYGDGYPSEAELDTLRTFEGTPREFVEYMGSIWRNGAGWSLKEEPHEFYTDGRTEWVAVFVTGGWSGCEHVQSVVEETMFSLMFYAAWKRGGYHEYRINPTQIDSRSKWGNWRKIAEDHR